MQFTGCNPGAPIPIFQKGQSELLMIFTSGTTASQLDAVANSLLPMTRAGIQSDLSEGLLVVGEPTCSPPEIEIGYRNSLSSKQLTSLESKLMSEPGVTKIEPAPSTSTSPQTLPASALTPSTATIFFRPVLCEIGPANATATAAAATTVNGTLCGAGGGAIASTPAASETATQGAVLPFVDGHNRYVLGPADLDAHDVASAALILPSDVQGGYQIQLTLTPAGASALNQLAAARYAAYQQNPSNPSPESMEAFEVGGVVESAPVFQSAEFNGDVVLGEGMTSQQANALLQLVDRAMHD